MKKILSGLIAFCIACFFIIPISATELPTIYYNQITGKTGDDIKVSVGIKNNTGLAGLLLRIEYNPNEVEIRNITNGTAFADAMFTPPDMSNKVNSPFVVSWVSLSGLNTNGIILNVDAKLKIDMERQYPIKIVSYEGNDINENDVAIVLDNGEVPTVCAENISSKQGDTVELPLRIVNNPGLSALGIKIDYDKSVLTLNEVVGSDLLADTYFEYGDITKTPIILNWTGISNISDDGNLAKLKFTINDGVENTNTTVRIVVVECVNSDETDVPLYGENSVISIKNTPAYKEYDVVFKNWNGDELQKTSFKEGEIPKYQGDKPTRDEDNDGKYEFKGWTPLIEPVTQEQVYTAQFDIVPKFTITYEANGGVINDDVYSQSYFKGEGAILPTDISKSNNTFVGWFDNERFEGEAITAITANDTGDKKYYAKWTRVESPEYLITFVNWDNSELQKFNVEPETMPVYNGAYPTKPADSDGKYVFKGWAPSVSAATQNQTYKAEFNLIRKYAINYNTNGGTIIDKSYPQEYYEGEGTALPVEVVKNDSVFVGWYDNEKLSGDAITTITAGDEGNKTYYAKWVQNTTTEYLITFINWDNSELQKSNVAVGTKPMYKGATPEKPADERYTYEFDGWTPAIKTANEITTYKATFRKMMKPLTDAYSVERIDGDGVKLIISPLKFVVQSVNLYKAIYNGDNTLKSVEVITCDLNDEGNIIVPLAKPNIGINESYKLMLWDKQQEPIIEAISSSDLFFESAE